MSGVGLGVEDARGGEVGPGVAVGRGMEVGAVGVALTVGTAGSPTIRVWAWACRGGRDQLPALSRAWAPK
jgi:hypothetical protein